jgi:hypothetical protein
MGIGEAEHQGLSKTGLYLFGLHKVYSKKGSWLQKCMPTQWGAQRVPIEEVVAGTSATDSGGLPTISDETTEQHEHLPMSGIVPEFSEQRGGGPEVQGIPMLTRSMNRSPTEAVGPSCHKGQASAQQTSEVGSGGLGGCVAVAGVWLRIPEGQCFCLLGPNGAGKTTTLKCLTGVRGSQS